MEALRRAARQCRPRRLADAAHRVDQLRAGFDQTVAGYQDRQVALRLRAAVLDWLEELRVQARHPRQSLRVRLAVFLWLA